jgi:hypothetical protein
MTNYLLPGCLQFPGGPTTATMITTPRYPGATFIRLSDAEKWLMVPLSGDLMTDEEFDYGKLLAEEWKNTNWDNLPKLTIEDENGNPVAYGGRTGE